MAKENGKQELVLTFEFRDQSDPDKSQVNTFRWVDDPATIALVQAAAIDPALQLMADRFQGMSDAKARANNPDLEGFLNSIKN